MSTQAMSITDRLPQEVTGGGVTFGNFDGVHRGHRELVAAAVSEGRKVGGPAVAVTFDPPPVVVLNPAIERKPPLTTAADRAKLLVTAGVDHVITLDTRSGLLALTAEQFFHDVVLGLFRPAAVVEGFNFRFGRDRAGDTTTLRQLCEKSGVAFVEVAPLRHGGEPVSSSRIRATLERGDVTAAAELLGRPHFITGVVEAGAKRGRTIGFPTANLGGVPMLIPGDGVYAVRAITAAGSHPAVANVGPNPTFGEHARKVEVHLLDFAGDLYGTDLRVEFVRRLRDTRRFAGPAELVEQLHRDVAAARAALG
jgi:riboflavin kinase/FMN adenylyltransferase